MNTVLVVEDDRRLARLVELNLSAEGYHVQVFHDGTGAQDYLSENCPDLILLDMMLSTVSGWDILGYVRNKENLKHIPVLAVTALAHPSEQNRTLRAGASGYLVKPFGIKELLILVKELLKGEHHERPLSSGY